MRDLALTRLIESGEANGDDLREMATLPLAARAHVLGKAIELCRHDDADVRAGAGTLLGGATGIQALRAIVGNLSDESEEVRKAAVQALRRSAVTQPFRMVHALFHPRLDVRRAALESELPPQAAQLATYLRADPECADLTRNLPWPAERLPLVFDLYAQGQLSARALLDQLELAGARELHEALGHEHKRTHGQVSRYLSELWAGGPLGLPPGRDVFDAIIGAIVETASFGHELAWVLTTVPQGEFLTMLRDRLLVAVLGHLARSPSAELWAAAITLDPLILQRPIFATASVGTSDALATLLARTDWPWCPTREETEALLALPHVRSNLALAASVAGFLRTDRLFTLEKILGEDPIVDSLRASDHGWRELCRLPHEARSPIERWLGQLRKWEPARATELEGIALSILSGKRLDEFIGEIKTGARGAAFLVLVQRTEITAHDEQLTVVLALLATRSDVTDFHEVLATLFADDADDRSRAVGIAVIRAFGAKILTPIAKKLADPVFARMVRVIDDLPEIDALPREREVALAEVALTREPPEIIAWGKRMLSPAQVAPPIARQLDRARKVLSERDRTKIATAPDDALETSIGTALGTPTAGLAEALGRRAARPSVVACVALLGAADPLPDVAMQLDCYSEDTLRFHDELDELAVDTWYAGAEPLPPLAHARLWRWEAHTERFAAWVTSVGGVLAVVQAAEALPGHLAAQTLWRGVAELLAYWRYRARERYKAEASIELAQFAATRVDGPNSVAAARLCVSLVEGGAVAISEIDNLLLDRAADASHATREHLARLIRLVGMPEPPSMRTPALRPTDIVAMIRATRDPDALVRFLSDERQGVVEEASIALASLGGVGQRRLAEAMRTLATLPHPLGLLATLPLWEDSEALALVAAIAHDMTLPPEWRFHLSLAVNELDDVFKTVHEPVENTWFRKTHWSQLLDRVPPATLARTLITAPPFHAYAPSIEILAAGTDDLGGDLDALERFLELGTERPIHLRRQAARILLVKGVRDVGLPILIAELCELDALEPANDYLADAERLFHPILLSGVVNAALIAGQEACSEKRMDVWQETFRRKGKVGAELAPMLALRILEYGQTKAARKNASALAVSKSLTDLRMHRVARVFAWGVRRGAELTGRKLSFHLTSEQRDLGHTYLDGSQVYVSALPMLRNEPNGEDIVEGLVLHEIGHHVYHRGEEAQRLWKQAHKEGLGHLLNLIADEHLERNLRAVDADYGDRLKRLDAYAFRHAPQEIKILVLVRSLRGSAAAGLIDAELELAFDEESVRMRRGAILGQLERAGHPLARFAGALRMGLGNRYSDPLVAEALAIVQRDKELRKQDMAGMYALTKEIAALFGGATACAAVFGGPEGLVFGERDDDVFSGKIEDDKLQKEVERILDPRTGGRARDGKSNKLAINVNPNEAFNHMVDVRRIAGKPDEHRKLATEVSRHADRLRASLDDLGLRWLPMRARTRGHALDRTRLRPLITHGDPRILQARTPTRKTDLFLGTLIDCSGSMQSGGNIERARKFGVLIAEAVRDLPGVDARFFGFTDRIMWDAGNAKNCDITGLEANGGNNDAGALLHMAEVAAASEKRARVLVMISDGLPTECSVAALRGLVTQLTRRKGMVCAQVAVRPLEEQCFPHHVLLDDAQIDVAVARFGRMIGDLVRRALGT